VGGSHHDPNVRYLHQLLIQRSSEAKKTQVENIIKKCYSNQDYILSETLRTEATREVDDVPMASIGIEAGPETVEKKILSIDKRIMPAKRANVDHAIQQRPKRRAAEQGDQKRRIQEDLLNGPRIPHDAPSITEFNHEDFELTRGDEKLGSGSFGSVYSAHKVDGTQVAVKVLNSSETQYLQEIKVASSLQHANILRYEGYYKKPNPQGFKLCLVMELMAWNLKDLVENAELRKEYNLEGALTSIYRQLAAGMAYAQSKHVLHRDLKPENCLVKLDNESNQVNVKIGDWGLARLASQHHYHTSNVGTLHYRAPETRANRYSHKADVWSYGILVWELEMSATDVCRKSVKDFFDKNKDGGKQPPETLNSRSVHHVFTKAVAACTRIHPEERPDFEKLRKMWERGEEYEALGNDL